MTLLPNLELELSGPHSPEVGELMDEFFEELDSYLPSIRSNESLWYNPKEVFKTIAEKVLACLPGPDVRNPSGVTGKSRCCYEEHIVGHKTDEQICRVLALQEYWYDYVDPASQFTLLSPEDKLNKLNDPQYKPSGILRGRRPFNWVAKVDELNTKLGKTKGSGKPRLTEKEVATRMRDLLGLVDMGEDYIVLITFPADVALEKSARPCILDGVIARFDHSHLDNDGARRSTLHRRRASWVALTRLCVAQFGSRRTSQSRE